LYISIKLGYHLLAAPAVESKRFTTIKPGPSLTFQAEAGWRYRVQVKDVGEIVFVWLEDEKTGSVVAGSKPEPSSQC